MKLLLITIALCLAAPYTLEAQPPQTYKVNPGEQPMYALPVEIRYTYPDFRVAVVQFRNGNFGGGKMNYSCLMEEMEFINDKGDTLALDDINAVKYINFNTDTFYVVQKFFVRQLGFNAGIRLCERRAVSIVNRERYGGHGELKSGSVSAVEQLSSSVNTMRRMVAQELITFTLDKTYYFGDRFGNFKLANKKNLLDVYGKSYPGLENFLAQNNVNYLKEEDMKLVLEFLSIDEQKKKQE